MPDLFISYARQDQDFVRRLERALETRGLDTWIDWEDIPPTAEWMREVEAGIEGSDSVLFVVSPDSVASTTCRHEIDIAVRSGKRKIPVVHRDVRTDLVPEAVRAHNWIFCRESDDFEAAVEAIHSALTTDLEWVHAHTRLLVRAVEWDANGRDRSFVLRGRDLEAAEAWQAGARDHSPDPTTLQLEYIAASRRAATRAGRVRLAAISVALVVATGLGVVAFLERGRARRQATLATARSLSASSVAQQSQDPELSVLLAIEAIERSDSDVADRALRQALEESRIVSSLQIGAPALSVAFSADGAHFVTMSEDGALLFDFGDEVSVRRLGKGRFPQDAEWSSDGTRVVTSYGDERGTAEVWDAATGRRMLRLRAGAPLNTAAFSPDARRLVTAGQDATARIWDAETGEAGTVLQGHAGGVQRAVFSPDGGRVLTASEDGTARIWDGASGAPLTTFSHGGTVMDAAFSPNSGLVVTATTGVAVVWDARDGRRVHDLVGHVGETPVRSARFSADSRRIVTAGLDGTARVWDVLSGHLVSILRGHRGFVTEATYPPDASRIVTAGSDGTVRFWEAEPNGRGLRVLRGGAPDEGRAAAISSDGTRAAAATYQQTTDRVEPLAIVWDVDADDAAPVVLRGHTGYVTGVALSRDGTRVATGAKDGTVRIWDARTGNEEAVLPLLSDGEAVSIRPNLAVDLSRDGSLLVVGGGAGASVWRLGRGEPEPLAVLTSPRTDVPTNDVRFSPDARRILVVGGYGARVWDWRHEAPVGRRLVGDPGFATGAFSPDGSRIVTAGAEGTAKVWAVGRSSQPLFVLRGHAGVVFDASYSADGTRIVTAGADGTVRVWDALRGGEALVVVKGHTASVTAAAFLPEGRLFSASRDQTLRIFRCDSCLPPGELLRLAQERVTRELTPAERRRYGV